MVLVTNVTLKIPELNCSFQSAIVKVPRFCFIDALSALRSVPVSGISLVVVTTNIKIAKKKKTGITSLNCNEEGTGS